MSVDITADRGDSVCVIGAGGSGLAAIKNLREWGFGVDCYERETSVGGAWNWRHDRSPVYASTHLISSKPVTQYPDFPMPDDWPDYPHHSQLLSYFERYADHFGLRPHVWFGKEPAPGKRPLKVNVFEHMLAHQGMLEQVPLFPYFGPGAVHAVQTDQVAAGILQLIADHV